MAKGIRKFKTIVPGLITFDTKLSKIKGFNLAENFNFYESTSKKERFHYSLIVDNNLEMPESYDFRNGYYFKKDGFWYYYKKLFFGASLKIKFDPKNKIFYFNRLYIKIPFEIGGINPVGKNISDMINLDLFLEGYHIIRGCAYRKNGKNVCIISPGYNGKTTLIKMVLSKHGKYISEDILILDLEKRRVFPTSPHAHNYLRGINKKLVISIKDELIINKPLDIDELILLQNSLDSSENYKTNKKLLDYLITCSLFFLNNLFVRSFIAEENLSEKVIAIIEKSSKTNIPHKFVKLIDFKVDF